MANVPLLLQSFRLRSNRALCGFASVLFFSAALTACASTPSNPNDPALAIPPLKADDALKAELNKSTAVDGSVEIVRLTLPPEFAETAPEDIRAEFAERELPFYPVSGEGIGPGVYEAVVPIPYRFNPGSTRILVRVGKAPNEKSFTLPFEVKDGNYRAETLKVKPKHVKPPAREEKRIKREIALVGYLYDKVTRKKYWNGPFLLPIDSPVTSPFGNQRLYNGELKNYHGGTDLKAPMNTPIKSTAAGVVTMAKNLYYTGNTVLVDHGYGVFSLYAHMTKMKVKVGDEVAAGALLGLSGQTGRVTGPHLHWQVIVRHVKVDPIEFTQVMR